jgi:hypothetical protein
MDPTVYKCDRCLRTFDTIKIVQGIYGTRHCNKCINEMKRHEIRDRIAIWTRPSPDVEDRSIPIHDLL